MKQLYQKFNHIKTTKMLTEKIHNHKINITFIQTLECEISTSFLKPIRLNKN